MSFFNSLKVSGSGLQAERLRVDLASANLANANSTRSADGGPYRRRDPVLRSVGLENHFGSRLERALRQVYVARVRVDPSPPRLVFDPSHPDANEDGMVALPNVRMVEEMTNLMNAQRSFEANLKAIGIGREMAQRALRIGRSR
jgi:flagellar basal-body rod protein FlgC